VLGVVPQRGYGIAVVIAQRAIRPEVFVVAAKGPPVWQRAGEAVHQPAVKRKLFISVSVVLVAGIRDAAIDSEWIHSIGVVGEQSGALEAIHARRILFRATKIFSAVIICLGVGIGSEIVVEGNVLLENDYDMLDRCLRRGINSVICECRSRGQKRHGRNGHNRHSSGEAMMHGKSLLGILSLEQQIETQETDTLAGRRGLEVVAARSSCA
jgi:hypothetical protein